MFTRRILTTVGAVLVLVSATALPATASGGNSAVPVGGAAAPIIGGRRVTYAEAPWGAAIYRSGKFHCTGTMIAPTWVLASIDCTGANLAVHVGDVFRPQGTEIEVSEFIVPPTVGDVALLRLARPFETTYSQLADTDPPVGSTTDICGWGSTSFNRPPSDYLQCANVRVTAVSGTCTDGESGPGICSSRPGGVAWSGDEGGPQFYEGRQVGVCSIIEGRSWQKHASVAAHRDWIRSVAGV